MSDRTDIIFNDARSQVRIQDSRRIYWKVESGNKMGKGRIRNLSTSGMLLETNSNFVPDQNAHFSFDTNLGHDNYVPQNGQLVWYRKKSFSRNKHLCGIKFIAPGEYVSGKLRQKVQKGLRGIVTARRLRAVTSGALVVVMVGLIGYIVRESGMIYKNLGKSNAILVDNSEQQAALTQSYASRYYTTQLRLDSTIQELEATKLLYSESETMLKDVRTELTNTKGTLSETRALLQKARDDLAATQQELSQMQNGNSELNGRVQKISANMTTLQTENESRRVELEKNISQLQVRNDTLTKEMADMETQLNYLSGNIKNITDGEALIRTYKARMKAVREKIKDFKREAELVRQKALKERDRIRMALGNNGFLIKDGKPVVVDQEKYNNAMQKALDDVEAQQQADKAAKPAKVNVDVSFVE